MNFQKNSCSLVLRTLLFYLPVTLVCLYQLLCYFQNIEHTLTRLEQRLESFKDSEPDFVRDPLSETVVIGLVACGTGHVRISEISVVLKSAIIFSKHPLKFVIFADKLKNEIVELLTRWNSTGTFVKLDWDIREPSYPEGSEAMVSLFVPCATQRLFFPDILTEYSRILYLDTDFIFLNSPHNTWKHFRQMDLEKRDVGMSIENADEKFSLFTYANHPSPKHGGFNSGMMLMNLEGLRKNGWTKKVLVINEELAPANVYGDQDIINTLFYYFPDLYYLVPCTANIRLDYCLPPSVEKACPQWTTLVEQTTSVSVDNNDNSDNNDDNSTMLPVMLHGSRGAFHDNWKLWDIKFFTSYFPNMINWFILKNIHLLEYAYRVQPLMANQAFFKIAFNVFLDFDIEHGNLSDLKKQLSSSLNARLKPEDVCYAIKDLIVDAIKVKL